ncbi:MAG: phospholipase D-like domain-containing protein [Candidatus Hodarchaeota archaeon]
MFKGLLDGEIFPKMEDLINTADCELLLVTPWFYKDEFKDSLIQKKVTEPSIIIKVLVRKFNDYDNKKNLETIRYLDRAGIQIGSINRIHAKFLIKDGKEMVLTTKNCTEARSPPIDVGVWLTDIEEIKKFRNYFLELWDRQFY